MLTEMRLQLPLELPLGAGAQRDYQAVLDIAMQMECQVSALLALARCEGNAVTVTLKEVDFDALIRKTWSAHLQAASARNVTAHFELPDRAAIRSDPDLLAAALTNLFSNAVAYSPRGGTIHCDVRHQNGQFQFRLTNATDQLEADDLDHVFEPFWRKNAARSDSTHTGLGLTLAKAYSTLLKLNLLVSLPEPGLFTVTLSAPPGGPA